MPDSGRKTLAVQEMYRLGRGRNLARIDQDTMNSLNISNGDIIGIVGHRKTFARCFPLYPTDSNKGIVRIDEVTRANAGVAIGDSVTMMKVEQIALATNILLSPIADSVTVSEDYLAQELADLPVTIGDGIAFSYFSEVIIFRVVDIKPQSHSGDNAAVLVTRQTQFTITPKYYVAYRSTFNPADFGETLSPIGVNIQTSGIVDESIHYDGLADVNGQPLGSKILELRLALSIEGMQGMEPEQIYRKMIPPGSDFDGISQQCIDLAVQIVKDENSKLQSLTKGFDPTTREYDDETTNKLSTATYEITNIILAKWAELG
jgi:hypothetical protein